MSEDRAHDPAALNLTWADSHAGVMALLPTGPVWPRDPQGVLSRTVRGMTGVHWRAWRRVRAMLNEADPRTAYETMDAWEADCGLPDPCLEEPPTDLEGRRQAVITKRQMGATTRPMDFIALAAGLGYLIEIEEFRPLRTWSNCDDSLHTDITGTGAHIGWPHTWLVRFVNPGGAIVRWMRCDSACNASIRSWKWGEDFICICERIKPAHTQIIWAYDVDRPLLVETIWDGGDTIWDDGDTVWRDYV